ncbi:hypothetical protein VTJ04DRAFT_8198 [Mycothermus thermophilus]|uniref:uncharacterized protein n=1 Tax=Humicola insolens TaxID=85995 RepID=UPI0037420459
MPPATPAPPRFVIKRPSTQQSQRQTPNPPPARPSSQFHATPRFTVSTPRPTPVSGGLTISTPALAFKSSTIRRPRATQDIIDDSSPVSPEDGSPAASPVAQDTLPEPIEPESSQVQQSPEEDIQDGRSPKRRRLSIPSEDGGTDPIISSQPAEPSDLGSLPDAPGDYIASFDTDSDGENGVKHLHEGGDDVAETSPVPSLPFPKRHRHRSISSPHTDSEDDHTRDNDTEENEPVLKHPPRPPPVPMFRTPAVPPASDNHHAPRFVRRTDPDDTAIPYPANANVAAVADLFSPPRPARRQRVGAADRYVPGGLAAELRDWLVEAKGGVDGEGEVKAASAVLGVTSPVGGAPRTRRVLVEEVSSGGVGLTLVVGRLLGDDVRLSVQLKKVKVILAGNGEADGLGAGTGGNLGPVRPSVVVAVAPPVWDVELGDQWAVASRWEIAGAESETLSDKQP